MKYGMNLLLWTGDLHEGILPTLEMLKEMGYDGVELPMFNLDVDKLAAWGKRFDDLGLGRTGVTVRGEEDNPISPDPAVRAKGVENNKRALDCCQAAGCSHLLGPYHSALGWFSTGKRDPGNADSARRARLDSVADVSIVTVRIEETIRRLANGLGAEPETAVSGVAWGAIQHRGVDAVLGFAVVGRAGISIVAE